MPLCTCGQAVLGAVLLKSGLRGRLPRVERAVMRPRLAGALPLSPVLYSVIFAALSFAAAAHGEGPVEKNPAAAALSAPWLADLEAESLLVSEATELAAKGNHAKALGNLRREVRAKGARPAVTCDVFGFRVASVAGFLRNQSRYAEADAFARQALALRDTDPQHCPQGPERAGVRYWRAQVLMEILDDTDAAAACLSGRGDDEPADERFARLAAQVAVRKASRR